MTQRTTLRRAIHLVLATSAGLPFTQAAVAQDQAAADQPSELGTQVVTGSRIRRVDLETASPVYTLDRSTIEQTGVTTLGDLIQNVPSIAGAATNPQVNNGGGDGSSNISLRGLGSSRTLVLLNGRRLGALSQVNGAVDVNLIPINMVERVEILKEGAGAIYGSDAIAGVVNFITRTDYEGSEAALDYGVSGEDDGERKSVSLSWGTSSDRGGIMLGANYNQQDGVSAADRDFARNAIYLYGSVFEGGSSRAPTGRIFLPRATFNGVYGCPGTAPEISVTRIEGTDGSDQADYRCFTAGDLYNYQPFNLVLTPQERGSVFTFANYDLSESVEVFAEVIHNYTTSGFEIAPLPFDARSDNVILSANSAFNPFGIELGGVDPITPMGNDQRPNALWRLESLGTRHSNVDTTTDQINLGLRGNIGASSWSWDVYAGFGRLDQDTGVDGYLFQPALQNAFGSSFINGDGVAQCGTQVAPIPLTQCTPVNPFNLEDPATIAALTAITASYAQEYKYTTQMASANLNGELFQMPAGPAQVAFGIEHREQEGRFNIDFLTVAQPPTFQNCLLAQETCSGASKGDFDVSEAYTEIFLPLAADASWAKALNLTLGARYSDYSTFGTSTNMVGKMEYRPISDLLIRASYAEVFRAPTVFDIFGAPTADSAQLNDPCVGLTAAQVTANPNLALACVNVPRGGALDGTFEQANSQISGLILGNDGGVLGWDALDGESGEVLTFGFVYEPGFAQGLSFTVDFWDYKIDNVITALDVQFSMDRCENTGNPLFCGLITRFGDGQIQVFAEPTVNLGSLETAGVDIGTKWRLRNTGVGDFLLTLDTTYVESYDNVVDGERIGNAGYYDRQFGNFARWRAIMGLGWSFKDIDALATSRYISKLKLADPDGFPGTQPDLFIDPQYYVDLTLGYTLMKNTKFTIGVENVGNEQPPIMYQNNVLNANTDVNTYDTMGRFYWGRVAHKF